MIVIVFGLPGSGKTYFATRLARLMDAVYISSDQLRKTLFKHRTYSAVEKQAVYEEMQRRITERLQEGRDIVLDATFYTKDLRAKIHKAFSTATLLVFIEITADEALVEKRITGKRADSEADFEVYKKVKQEWEVPEFAHLVVESTDENIDDMLLQAKDYIQAENDKSGNRSINFAR
jgi:predicted kinase